MPTWLIAILIPVGLLALCVAVYLAWVALGTQKPVHRDPSDPDVDHWSNPS
ncbi:hypothetical protein [Streptomyces sp. KLOTTS4A1]|uniref:hypothetical protein n=1 Tax=Streptomyces sp. KLOTTS4A1 TaxID=3390996 RepID=UPI0039F5E068